MTQDNWTASGVGDWTTGSDWSLGSPPTSGEDAFIGTNTGSLVGSSADVTVNSLGVSSAYTLDINSGSVFTLTNGTGLQEILGTIAVLDASDLKIENGTFENAGTVELESSGAQTGFLVVGDVSLTGGGSIIFEPGVSGSQNFLSGLGSSAELNNFTDDISGTGLIENVFFTNEAGGAVETNDALGTGDLQIWGSANGGNFVNAGTVKADNGGTLQLGEAPGSIAATIINDALIEALGANKNTLIYIAGNVTINQSGGGEILLGGSSPGFDRIVSNGIVGDAVLTINGGTVAGAGDIGDRTALVLNIGPGTVINADLSQPLTLDTGTFTITNAGQIEANTLLDIDSPVNNANGVISIGAGGTLRLLDSASISGNVQFNGANATLQLDVAGNPISGYVAGAIAGDAIDFSSVITPFSASNSLHWKQKGAAGGVLSLVNSSGSTLASVTLAGSFIASDFSMSKNGSDTLATIVASVPWSTANDFNADAMSDILWRQSGTNTLADWSMNGSTISQSNVLSAAPDSSWSVAGIGDFNGDGKSDILWRQSGTNTLADWTMNGGVIAQSNVLSAAPDSSWSVAGIGDFSGDGDADILWRQSGTNTLADWTMNGSTISQSNVLSAAPDSSWSVAGIGDFNGDGKADILWRQSGTGTLADWTMNGPTISQSNVLSAAPDSSWSVAGIGDFNGDGNADILWRQSGTNTLAEWLMNGSTISSSQVISAAPDSTWSIVEIGDFNGDGNSDILWRNTSGTLADWTMNGSTISASNVLSSAPDSTWSIQAKPTNFA